MIALRRAAEADIPLLARWDLDEDVVASSGADKAEPGDDGEAYWRDELALQSDVFQYFIAEEDGRPVGAMLVIDPHLEPTKYWGDVAPNQRAIDIWIGSAADRNRGLGALMMRQAIAACFADPAVTSILIDPLAENLRAIRFYERLGFRFVERRTFGSDPCMVYRLDRASWLEGRAGA